MKRHLVIATASFALCAGMISLSQAQEPKESTEGLDMQAARAKMMSARGSKVAYTKKWDLSGLPKYQPKQKVNGTIRMWGSNYITDGFLGGYWEAAFRKFHPDVKFDFHMKTTLAAVPSLIFGVSDLGIGRKITFAEQELFERYTDRSPVEIELATGSFDVPGWQPGYGVVVQKDNPLTKITMEQLDGVFGADTGEWADKPINVYGLTLRYHQATEISDRVLKASDKWNERLKIYANFVSKAGKLERGMNEDLAADKYGIGIVAAPTTNLTGGASQPTQKVLAVAAKDGGTYIPYTLDTLQNRTYPLYDRIFAYTDREQGKPMNPAVLEFLRFVLSQEGQAEVMRDGKYLPLTAEVANAQLKKLEEAAK